MATSEAMVASNCRKVAVQLAWRATFPQTIMTFVFPVVRSPTVAWFVIQIGFLGFLNANSQRAREKMCTSYHKLPAQLSVSESQGGISRLKARVRTQDAWGKWFCDIFMNIKEQPRQIPARKLNSSVEAAFLSSDRI